MIADGVVSQQASATSSSESAPKEVSADDRAAAEQAKSKGNQLMAQKNYQGAIDAYGEAIEKDGQNAVYWSNRFVFNTLLLSSFRPRF